jgi:hypothetical protein
MRHLLTIALAVAMATGLVNAQQATQTTDIPLLTGALAAKEITPPELISGDQAEYPVEASFQQIDGMCLVSMVVSIQGNPENVRIIHCTDSSFEDGSSDAVKQYRFKAATTQEGNPVPVTVSAVLRYHWIKHYLSLHMIFYNSILLPVIPDKRLLNLDRHMSKSDVNREVSKPIRYSFIPERGGASVPGADGVYPLTRDVTGPRVITFSDNGYGHLAFVHEGNSTCDVMLTISTKGKASDPQVTHCERPELEKPAVESLLKSEYKPGFVNGKAVPMRASIHLEYGDSPAKPE